MYKLHLTSKAQRKLSLIPKIYKSSIANVFDEICDEPFLGKPLGRKFEGFFSIRIGVYRIVYKVNRKDKLVTIVTAGHRSSVYVNDES